MKLKKAATINIKDKSYIEAFEKNESFNYIRPHFNLCGL